MPETEKQQLNWRDYREVITRRRWILLGVLFVAGLAGTLGADLWPVRYRSEALILVERQDVPSHYVQPNVTSDVQQRLQAITQQVLSRTRLDRMITQFGLYPKDSKRLGREKLIEEMRDDIDVVPVLTADRNQLTAFRVLYTYDNPQTAQQVANELTSEFINESLRARTQASMATTDFLQTQLDRATKQLASAATQAGTLTTSSAMRNQRPATGCRVENGIPAAGPSTVRLRWVPSAPAEPFSPTRVKTDAHKGRLASRLTAARRISWLYKSSRDHR